MNIFLFIFCLIIIILVLLDHYGIIYLDEKNNVKFDIDFYSFRCKIYNFLHKNIINKNIINKNKNKK